jgi:hypothetical protein
MHRPTRRVSHGDTPADHPAILIREIILIREKAGHPHP